VLSFSIVRFITVLDLISVPYRTSLLWISFVLVPAVLWYDIRNSDRWADAGTNDENPTIGLESIVFIVFVSIPVVGDFAVWVVYFGLALAPIASWGLRKVGQFAGFIFK